MVTLFKIMNPKSIIPSIGITMHKLNMPELLSNILRGEENLSMKTRRFYRNVREKQQKELQDLFQEQYSHIDCIIDRVLQKVATLSGNKGLHYIRSDSFEEDWTEYSSSREMIQELMADHRLLIVKLRKYVISIFKNKNDAEIINFLIGLIEEHETTAWVLETYAEFSNEK